QLFIDDIHLLYLAFGHHLDEFLQVGFFGGIRRKQLQRKQYQQNNAVYPVKIEAGRARTLNRFSGGFSASSKRVLRGFLLILFPISRFCVFLHSMAIGISALCRKATYSADIQDEQEVQQKT